MCTKPSGVLDSLLIHYVVLKDFHMLKGSLIKGSFTRALYLASISDQSHAETKSYLRVGREVLMKPPAAAFTRKFFFLYLCGYTLWTIKYSHPSSSCVQKKLTQII